MFSLPVDVLCPCALSHSLRGENADSVRARIISSGANVPLTQEAVERFQARSVLVLPDFMTSAGGILGIFLEIGGFGPEEAARLIPELIGPRVREFIDVSESKGIPPDRMAAAAALGRFARLKEKIEGTTIGGRFLSHKMVRPFRRLLPRSAARRLSLAYFRRSLAGPMFRDPDPAGGGAPGGPGSPITPAPGRASRG